MSLHLVLLYICTTHPHNTPTCHISISVSYHSGDNLQSVTQQLQRNIPCASQFFLLRSKKKSKLVYCLMAGRQVWETVSRACRHTRQPPSLPQLS